MKPTYTRADVGCYVDGSRGIYAVDFIVSFANDHGADITHDDCEGEHYPTCYEDSSDFAGCEFAAEFEDDATDYMNDTYPVNGCYWGRSEQGDWGLWESEDDEDDEDDSITDHGFETEEPTEPEDGDITTEDHKSFYQHGHVVLIGHDDDDHYIYLPELASDWRDLGTFADCNDALRAYMGRTQYWPNCWFISDHGNAHLITFDKE